jgi:hypothetical protein
MNPLFEKIH